MKNWKKITMLGVCSLLLCSCGNNPTLSDGSGSVVNLKDVSSVSANELYDDMKKTAGLESMINLMDKRILESKYSSKKDEALKNAKSTLKSMIDTYGEETIINYFGSTEAYQNNLYLSNLKEYAIKDYAKTLVTEDEAKSYYEKNIYGDIKVSHILITTGVKKDTSSEEKTKLENEAKNKINEIIKKLDEAENKAEEFKKLAKEYSEDEATKDNGGSLGSINTGSLTSAYDELLKAARNLKDGEYSKDIITTELGYHVIYRESSSEKKSYDDSKDSIYETLANDKRENDKTIDITALDELRKSYGMEINDNELKTKYSNYIANQISSLKANNTSK